MKIDIPCLNTKLVPREQVKANSYNPNNVPRDKMELLKQSIINNGFCFPIVVIGDKDDEAYVVIDGFHRGTICQPEGLDIKEVPVVVLQHGMDKRLAATIEFNKARGVHDVNGDAEIVRRLVDLGGDDKKISKHLGMSEEAIHRYKNLTGIMELFENVEYSASWEVGEFDEDGNKVEKSG